MSSMNRFGCTAQMVADIFTTGSYQATVRDFGGAPAVELVADGICDELIQNMPEDMFLSLSNVELEKIEVRATAGQTTARLGIVPVVDGKTHIWANQPRWFFWKPRKQTDIPINEDYADPEVTPTNELASTAFTCDASTGIITFVTPLSANDEVYASYEPDPNLIRIDSLAKIIAEGAAHMLGTKQYARGTSQWMYITLLEENYTNKLKALRAGDWIPPEIRLKKYWRERMPEADKKTSVQIGRLYRG